MIAITRPIRKKAQIIPALNIASTTEHLLRRTPKRRAEKKMVGLFFIFNICLIIITVKEIAHKNSEVLVKKLTNPVASLKSVPFHNNSDYGVVDSLSGTRYRMNYQPVIPIHLSNKLPLITRYIIPL